MYENCNKKQLRDFGITLGLGIPLFFGFIIPFITGHSPRIVTLWLGLVFLALGFFCPKYLKTLYIFWMKIGNFLGYINSHIILGIVFILVMQPIAFLARLVCYDPLRKKFLKVSSYREIKKEQYINFTKIF